MKVTKGMLDEELRGRFTVGRLLGSVLASEGPARVLLKLGRWAGLGGNIKGLDCDERTISSRHGGRDFRIRVYRPAQADGPLPGMLYIHGGGYLGGKPEEYHTIIRRLIEASPCVVVSPDYRKAFEAPYPAAFDDCTDTLVWLRDNAVALGARGDTFIVAGHSAGGGLTAAVSAWATDTDEVPIAFQMPVYPMIDDRPTASNTDNDAPVWNSKANQLGWRTYLRVGSTSACRKKCALGTR